MIFLLQIFRCPVSSILPLVSVTHLLGFQNTQQSWTHHSILDYNSAKTPGSIQWSWSGTSSEIFRKDVVVKHPFFSVQTVSNFLPPFSPGKIHIWGKILEAHNFDILEKAWFDESWSGPVLREVFMWVHHQTHWRLQTYQFSAHSAMLLTKTKKGKQTKHCKNCEWHQTLRPRLEAQGQGVCLHCHLADIVKSQQLQPILWAVSTLPERELPDHVPALHRLAQQEERDLCQLPPQSKQAAGKVRVHATVFSPVNPFFVFGMEMEWCFPNRPCYVCLMI